MFEIKITVDPTFTAAVNALASALAAKITTACNNNAAAAQPAVPVAPIQTAPAAVPVAPTAPAPAPAPAPAAAPAAVPTSAPTFTMEQISRAGTMLIDMGKMNDLMALLARHGVAAITQLKPESYGTVATELRALGAQI